MAGLRETSFSPPKGILIGGMFFLNAHRFENHCDVFINFMASVESRINNYFGEGIW